MKYKNLIFDLDGTLWDSRFSIIQNWNEVLIQHKVIENKLSVDDMTPFMGLLAKDVLKSLNPQLTKTKIKDILTLIQENETRAIKKYGGILYPGVEDKLPELSKLHNVYIVSNCQSGYIEAFLDYFGFESLVNDFESHGRSGLDKAANIHHLVQRNNLKPADSVYIGDTQTDSDAAKLNNLDFIFCEYGFGGMETSRNVVKIQSFSELLNHI